MRGKAGKIYRESRDLRYLLNAHSGRYLFKILALGYILRFEIQSERESERLHTRLLRVSFEFIKSLGNLVKENSAGV